MAAASDWEREQEVILPLSKLPGYPQEFEYLTMIRLKLAQGQCRDLPIYLDGIIRNAESQGRKAVVIESLTLKAIALDYFSESSEAAAALDRALALAEPAGYVHTFIDEGVSLAAVLRKTIAGGKHIDYAKKLLGLLAALQRSVPGIVEALSQREIEVLRLIAAGKSNQEIASGLFLAMGTVKKHIYNIFGKLGVDSRTQAVARARELGLV